MEPKTDTSGDKCPLLKNVIYKDKLGNLQVNTLTNGLISYRWPLRYLIKIQEYLYMLRFKIFSL